MIFHVQDLWKNVLPKFMNRHVGVPLGAQILRPKTKKTSVFELSYKSVNSSLWELIKIKEIYIFR